MSDPQTAAEPMPDRSKTVLKAVFITLFLDLVGFSIIFPLFPAMLEYYVGKEGDTGLLGAFVGALESLSNVVGAPGDAGITVLFGGILASLFSLLQFLFSPILGSLSDRYGRKPILLLSITGIAISYGLWFFAGSFAMLCIARILGGIAAGNISTASAVVADVTTVRNRPRGMAIIGMAFGLGFILGPAIGGFSAQINLAEHFPDLVRFGVNPFSMPALIAMMLSIANLIYVALFFHETLSTQPVADGRLERTINPFALFSTSEYPGVTQTNLINFFFLAAFSGAEFGLTFLAAERLGYGPRQNAYLFLFIGVVLALVQGGYVRRRAPIIGPKRMAMHGFVMLTPGVALLSIASSAPVIYAALGLMAVGSAQVIPCLTSLASAYTPGHVQGRVLGVFRSLGALARGVGPLFGCVLYWRLGPTTAYAILAAAMIIPLVIAASLPPITSTDLAKE